MAAGMDAFITKPITPEKLRMVLADRGGCGLGPAPSPGPELPVTGATGLRLDLILHLADGSPDSMARELAAFAASLDEAMNGVAAASASGSRQAVSSAAHRVLSLARMVGSEPLADTAADLQDYASAYSVSELRDEVALLVRHAGELAGTLARLGESVPLNRS
jgi:HPt (histidine-containing phosphotransfer) domain-containing protein